MDRAPSPVGPRRPAGPELRAEIWHVIQDLPVSHHAAVPPWLSPYQGSSAASRKPIT